MPWGIKAVDAAGNKTFDTDGLTNLAKLLATTTLTAGQTSGSGYFTWGQTGAPTWTIPRQLTVMLVLLGTFQFFAPSTSTPWPANQATLEGWVWPYVSNDPVAIPNEAAGLGLHQQGNIPAGWSVQGSNISVYVPRLVTLAAGTYSCYGGTYVPDAAFSMYSPFGKVMAWQLGN